MRSQPKLKAKKVALSLIFAAFLGASIVCLEYLVGVYQGNGAEYFREYGAPVGLTVFISAFMIFLLALCLFGGPVWIVLHRKRWTHWICALSAGFLIPFVINFAMQTSFLTGSSPYTSFYANGGDQVLEGRLTSFGWKMAFLSSLYYAVVGTALSMSIWFINYKTK